jgi:antitoxin component YwqK of YwqJK toxin-antitoxin module
MNPKLIVTILLVAIPLLGFNQDKSATNKTDQSGRKQGKWIKYYPGGMIMYEGIFKNDHPVGEFKRYYETSILKSLMIYSDDGTIVDATLYHDNGYPASKGRYVNQKKEGKWKFYSDQTSKCLISEENYKADLRNGEALKFYPDSTVSERVNYINDIKQGEWIQYYPGGKICLKSAYQNGKINGKYEVWYPDGKPEFTGQYKEDVRDGNWLIFNEDGTIRYRLEYEDGIAKNNKLDIDKSAYIDSLESNKGKIADPEKNVIIK